MSVDATGKYDQVTRFVLVNYRKDRPGYPRQIDLGGCDVEVAVQDDGRTLKVFLWEQDTKPSAVADPNVPVKVEGPVWLYRSNVDGAEVLVRWKDGAWETGDIVIGGWYADNPPIENWRGKFTRLEEGFPR